MVIDYNLRVPVEQNAATTSAPKAAAASTSGDNAFSALFIKLLASQLKSQSPLDPVDPTAFIGQLVQLNSLNELTQIRQLLSGATTTPPPAAAAQSYSSSSFSTASSSTSGYSTSTKSILSPTQGA